MNHPIRRYDRATNISGWGRGDGALGRLEGCANRKCGGSGVVGGSYQVWRESPAARRDHPASCVNPGNDCWVVLFFVLLTGAPLPLLYG